MHTHTKKLPSWKSEHSMWLRWMASVTLRTTYIIIDSMIWSVGKNLILWNSYMRLYPSISYTFISIIDTQENETANERNIISPSSHVTCWELLSRESQYYNIVTKVPVCIFFLFSFTENVEFPHGYLCWTFMHEIVRCIIDGWNDIEISLYIFLFL